MEQFQTIKSWIITQIFHSTLANLAPLKHRMVGGGETAIPVNVLKAIVSGRYPQRISWNKYNVIQSTPLKQVHAAGSMLYLKSS